MSMCEKNLIITKRRASLLRQPTGTFRIRLNYKKSHPIPIVNQKIVRTFAPVRG